VSVRAAVAPGRGPQRVPQTAAGCAARGQLRLRLLRGQTPAATASARPLLESSANADRVRRRAPRLRRLRAARGGRPGPRAAAALALPVDPALVLPAGLAFSAAAYAAALVSARAGSPMPRTGPRPDAATGRLAAGGGAVPGGGAARDRLRRRLPGPRPVPENRLLPDESFSYDRVLPDDAAFHVGLTHELTFAYPPQIPGPPASR